MQAPKVYTLEALCDSIGKAIAEKAGGRRYWIRAEIAQYNLHSSSGHAYLDLAQQKDNVLLAKAQAVIWKNDLLQIAESLGAEMNQVLRKGSEIQCSVELSFHNVHGLKLLLKEIDLSFNLGELERRKRETLLWLKEAGLLRKNAEWPLPPVLQRLAIVGAPESAGFADFVRQLRKNVQGYRFGLELYPVRVQGEGAAKLISDALLSLKSQTFDAVVLIRGGGSRLDLDAFNDRKLAAIIANLDLPVLSGIGHETDRSVADEVAHSSFKTPTAVAAFILDRANAFEWDQRQRLERIRFLASKHIKEERVRIHGFREVFGLRALGLARLRELALRQSAQRLTRTLQQRLSARAHALHLYGDHMARLSHRRLSREAPALLKNRAQQLEWVLRQRIRQSELQHSDSAQQLQLLARFLLTREHQNLSSASGAVSMLHPDRILARGFALIRRNGQVLRPGEPLAQNEKVQIVLIDRELDVKIVNISIRKNTT